MDQPLSPPSRSLEPFLDLLRCPRTQEPLRLEGERLLTEGGAEIPLDPAGIPLFARELLREESRRQQEHYDRVASLYLEHQDPPHVREYLDFVDGLLLAEVRRPVRTLVELCCGRGDALALPGLNYGRGVGVDVSTAMLSAGVQALRDRRALLVQGDATSLPLRDEACDAVVVLGGIHHVPDRAALFREVARVLEPGGRFYWREPVDDFLPWRALRALIYRLSPNLDHATEEPLRRERTEAELARAGLRLDSWRTCGFLAWAGLLNAEVLVVNRFFRYLPGMRTVARAGIRFDEALLGQAWLRSRGLQVVGVAEKPAL